MNEREFQRETVKTLRKLGYTVWVTSTNRKSRNTVGCPDIIVSLGMGFCLAIELKGDDTKLTGEQEYLSADGQILVFRPGGDVLLNVRRAHKLLILAGSLVDNQAGEMNVNKTKIGITRKSRVGKSRDKGTNQGTVKTGAR